MRLFSSLIAARDAAISIKLRAGIGSSKAEQGPLIVPSQRQARLYQQLVCGQPARQAPLENGSRDVWGEIAEADKPRENQLQKSGERIIVFRQWVGWRRSAARGTIKAPKLSVRLEGLRPSEPGARNPVVCVRLAAFGFAVGAWDSFNRIKKGRYLLRD